MCVVQLPQLIRFYPHSKLIFLQMESWVEVGPIWNQRHAEQKAAEYIRNHPDYVWTGHWNTTQPGRMSIIQIRRRHPAVSNAPGPSPTQNVEVGPIWNQRHAKEKAAEYIRNHPEYQWTGHWNTTQPGIMSTIQIERRNPSAPHPINAIPRAENIATPGDVHDVEVGDIRNHRDAAEDFEINDFVLIPRPDTENRPVGAIHEDEKAESNIATSEADKRNRPHAESYLPTCPICWEAMSPPRRIFQCSNGHLVCEVCRSQPQVRGCPTCRQPIMGRATAMEQLLQNLQKQI